MPARVATAPRGGAIAWPLRPVPGRARPAKPAGGLLPRLGAFVLSLPDHSLLDRVVRGRVWIPLLGVLLAGIVFTQVEILKLGADMGRAIEQTTTLTSQNEQLRGSVAKLGDDQRIERLAGAMGMVLPPPGAVGYLAAESGGNVGGALSNIHSTDPSAFVWLTARNGAMVTGQGTSTLPPAAGAAAPTVSTPSATTSATGSGSSTAPPETGTQSSVTATQSTQASATSTQAPATTGEATTGEATTGPATTDQTPTNQSQTATSQTSATTAPADQATQTPATGAGAIQPADSSQPSAGG